MIKSQYGLRNEDNFFIYDTFDSPYVNSIFLSSHYTFLYRFFKRF
jgi:hypothetical protein